VLPTHRTRHVDHIIHAASDPDVAVSINACAVTRKIVALHDSSFSAANVFHCSAWHCCCTMSRGALCMPLHAAPDLEGLEVCLLKALVVLVQVCRSTST
jgi:hypothetical protein